jgi:hypothetical protein
MDQPRSTLPEHRKPYQSNSQSDEKKRDLRDKLNRSAGEVDIIALVRSLQRTAGMTDCFRMGNADCDIIDCDWRSYCLGKPARRKKDETPPKPK